MFRAFPCILAGTKMAAVVGGPNDPLYYSTDSGTSWTATQSAGKPWRSVAYSGDGTKIIAGSGNTNPLYYSTTGQTLNQANGAPGTGCWDAVASDSAGTRLTALTIPNCGGLNTDLYTSTDGGANFAAKNTGFLDMYNVASSANGQILVI
jgi:hypothetical protein